jgi:hypothetical protein
MEIKPYNDKSNCKKRNMTRTNSTDYSIKFFSKQSKMEQLSGAHTTFLPVALQPEAQRANPSGRMGDAAPGQNKGQKDQEAESVRRALNLGPP